MEFLIILVILAALVMFVSAPLRRAAIADPGAGSERVDSDLEELEAAREAKYRELRDAELDHRTGKLSDDDYEQVDRALRGEAIEILRSIDRALPSPEP
jgi:hypothetical protein